MTEKTATGRYRPVAEEPSLGFEDFVACRVHAMQRPLHDFGCDEDIHGKCLDRKNNSVFVRAFEIVLGVAETRAEAHIRRVFAVDLFSGPVPFIKLVSDIVDQLVVLDEIRARGLFGQLLFELRRCVNTLRIDAEQA